MPITPKEKDMLRRLAGQQAEISALPVQREKAEMWRKLNRLEKVRPMVWINEVCWEEMGPEVVPQIQSDRLLRHVEEEIRQTLYQWKHFPADMIVDDFIPCPVALRDTGFGLVEEADWPEGVDKGARHFKSVINTDADIENIHTPQVSVDWDETNRRMALLEDIFAGIIPIRRRGVIHTWFAPVDTVVMHYGIERLYTDLLDRPEFVHRAIGRVADAMIGQYKQYEQLGVLELNNCNIRVSSGGLGVTDELPAEGFAGKVRLRDMWGHCSPQIFCEVSPAMHEEFALSHEIRILENFGLNGYGCCEPLHKKIGILRQIPRLRRISMSPFVDIAEGAAAIGQDFIYSAKPNPAVLAGEAFHPDHARAALAEVLDQTRGLHREIIMKDIHTTRHDPARIDRWAEIAMEMAEKQGAE
jgi:hypothetical protein